VINEAAAVPIPASVWIMASGLLALVGVRRKFCLPASVNRHLRQGRASRPCFFRARSGASLFQENAGILQEGID